MRTSPVAALLILFGLAIRAEAQAPPQSVTQQFLEAINKSRAVEKDRVGRLTVEESKILADMAQEHAKLMADGLRKFGHVEFEARLEKLRYLYGILVVVGENEIVGSPTPAMAVLGWLNSPEHRKNILGDFTHVGGGQARGPAGHFMVTLHVKAEGGLLVRKHFEAEERARLTREAVELINAFRKTKNLPPFKASGPVMSAAAEDADHSAANGGRIREGAEFRKTTTKLGYAEYYMLSRDGRDAFTPAEAVKRFSAGASSYLLLEGSLDIGIGVQRSPIDGRYHWALAVVTPSTSTASTPNPVTKTPMEIAKPKPMGGYTVRIATGNVAGAGTNGTIFLQLTGTKGSSTFNQIVGTKGKLEAGNVFEHNVSADYGRITKVGLQCNVTNPDQQWFVDHVTVQGPGGEIDRFEFNHWFRDFSPSSREAKK